ncbi:unnamed protein product [Dicrocoelium dendriticum]|nr:unnamed protein product [Dicrocoelium dendriticum]
MAVNLSFSEVLCHFAVDLYDQIIKEQSPQFKNVFWSPMSVHAAIALIMAGASGVTKQEMVKMLHVPDTLNESQAHELFGSTFVNISQSSKTVEVAAANRLFLLQPAKILPEYSKTLSKHYNAETESLVEFGGLENKRVHMNKWVSNVTKGKINDLIPPDALSESSILTILNALYFKGLWEHPFAKNRTTNATFYLLDGKTLEVPMMYIKERLPYIWLADLDADVIRLPFLGADWEMLIVLTREKSKFPGLLAHLREPGKLTELMNTELDLIEMELYMPKFRLAGSKALDVKELLKRCGMTSAFDSVHADLSRMCSNGKLFVSELLHKAVLEVDEEGATAAATTGVFFSFRSGFGPPTFRVDHPFFVTLVYKSNVPAFIGHIVVPEKF